MTMEKKKIINRLLDEYLSLYNSPRNKRIKSYWIEKPSGFSVNLFRQDEPKKYTETGAIPVVVNPCETIFSYLFNFSLIDYYTNPYVYLEMYLRQRISQFKTFMDDSPLRLEIPIWLGSYFEYSIFDVETIYTEHESPKAKYEVIVKNEKDLERFKEIDFNNKGLIPMAKHFYEVISELVEGKDIKVSMPYFISGPFGILVQLVGFGELFYKAVDNPEFIKEAMRIITKTSIDYEKWINKNYNCVIKPKGIHNDDVNCPVISPQFYLDFIFPFEKEIEKEYGSISYWHSCGNCTDLLEIIKKLKIETLNIGFAGDINKYLKSFGPNYAYEICVHPVKDVLSAETRKMEQKINSILEACSNNKILAFSIMASALLGTGKVNIANDIKNIIKWVKIARRSVSEYVIHREKYSIFS